MANAIITPQDPRYYKIFWENGKRKWVMNTHPKSSAKTKLRLINYDWKESYRDVMFNPEGFSFNQIKRFNCYHLMNSGYRDEDCPRINSNFLKSRCFGTFNGILPNTAVYNYIAVILSLF